MRKWFREHGKQVLSFLLCVCLIFGIYIEGAAEAQAFAITGAAIVVGVALLASLGLTFMPDAVDQATQAVVDMVNSFDEVARDAFMLIPTHYRVIWNVANAAYQVVTHIDDVSYGAGRSWVQQNYSVGANSYSGSVVSFPASDLPVFPSSIVAYSSSVSLLPVFFTSATGSYVSWFIDGDLLCRGNLSSDGQFSIQSTFDLSNVLELRLSSSSGKGYYSVATLSGVGGASGGLSAIYSAFSYTDSFDAGVVIGIPDIVDNPTYDWNNAATGERSVSWYPPTTADGRVMVDDAGYPLVGGVTKPLVNDAGEVIGGDAVLAESLRNILELEHSEVVALDVTGVAVPTVADEVDIGTVASSLGPSIGRLGDGIRNLFPAIGAFALNLVDLYRWVPPDTRKYIAMALSIAVTAVVYKLVRG